MARRLRAENLIPLIVLVVSFGFLWFHAAPSVTFHDSGEFAMAAASAGIPHPPGAPTWSILASGFVRLLHWVEPARASNLFSAFCGACALALLSLIAGRWCKAAGFTFRSIAAVSAPVFLLSSSAFLEQGTTTEQYTLLLFLLLLLIIISDWIAAAPEKLIRTFAFGLVWALATGNHPSQVCLGLLAIYVVIRPKGSGLARLHWAKRAISLAIGFVVGCSVFAWLPLRSRANPLMDWGNIENLSRLVWALSRKQWPTRPISTAPSGFVLEWLKSYQPIVQLGAAGVIAALIGIIAFARCGRARLAILILAVVPYLAVMLLGHLRQQRMDIAYIHHYGVIDWHLPLYAAMALLAGAGLCRVCDYFRKQSSGRAVLIACWGVVGWSATMGLISAERESLRADPAPDIYIHSLSDPLPADSIVLLSSDNTSNMLSYDRYIRRPQSHQFIAYCLTPLSSYISNDVSRDDWSTASLVRFITQTIAKPEDQPLRVPWVSAADVQSRPVFSEYRPDWPQSAHYLLPQGFLYAVSTDRVTTGEVLENDQIYSRYLVRKSNKRSYHRLENEAFGLLWQARGGYFAELELWEQAFDSYAESLKWLPDDGSAWFCLGDTCEHLDQAAKAIIAYKAAIEHSPHLAGPRANLGVIYASAGKLKEAAQYFEEELQVDPGSVVATENLARVREQLKNGNVGE
jgi:hypothetical protein